MVQVGSLSDISTWLMLLVVAAYLFYICGVKPFRVWTKLGIQGPIPSMLMGNAAEFFNPRNNMRAVITKWRQQYGDIFGIYLFRDPVLLVMEPKMIKQILIKNFHNFQDRFNIGGVTMNNAILKSAIFFETGPNWRRLRKIVSPTFTPSKLKQLMHHINRTASQLGHKMHQCALQNKVVEAKTVFGAFSLDVICRTFLGIDANSHENPENPILKRAVSMTTFDTMTKLKMICTGIFRPSRHFFNLIGLDIFNTPDIKYLVDTIASIIADRKANPEQNKTDFLQIMINAEADPSEQNLTKAIKMTTDEIIAQGIIFMIGGFDTTSTTLQFLFYELVRHPDIQQNVIEEIEEVLGQSTVPTYEKCLELKYLEAVINETLRLYPPIHIIHRVAEKDIQLDDIAIPANAGVIIPASVVMQDPDLFPEPGTFKPERFLNEGKQGSNEITFLPFGFGPRQCMGMRLAMIELKVAVIHVLTKVKFTDATPKVLDIEDYTTLMVPKERVYLTVQAI